MQKIRVGLQMISVKDFQPPIPTQEVMAAAAARIPRI